METLNFKTNINTDMESATLTPFLNDIEQVDGWNVDTDSPEKILTVQTIDNRIGAIIIQAVEIQAVERAGYKAERIPRP